MKATKTIVYIATAFSLAACSSIIKGCGKTLDNASSTALREIQSGFDNAGAARQLRNKVADFYFDIPIVKRISQDPEFQRLQDISLKECYREQWRLDLKAYVRKLSAQEITDQKFMELVKDIGNKLFSKELLSIGPVVARLHPTKVSANLEFSTPCGIELFDASLAEGRTIIKVEPTDESNRTLSLEQLYGDWDGVDTIEYEEVNLLFSYTENFYKRFDINYGLSIGTVSFFSKEYSAVVATIDYTMSFKISLQGNLLKSRDFKMNFRNVQNPLGLDIESVTSVFSSGIQNLDELNLNIKLLNNKLLVVEDEDGKIIRSVRTRP